MFIAELALMISGSREALEVFIHKLSDDSFISQTRLFRHFKLIPVGHFWMFAFCHHAYEWDVESECAWSDIYDAAKSMGLIVHEKSLKEKLEWYECDEFDPSDYLDSHEDIFSEHENLLKMMESLITKKLVFAPELTAAFKL